MEGFCRDCLKNVPSDTSCCEGCGSLRLLRHPDLEMLAMAHVDCDAFYATIEKRDNPALADHPVIVGGGRRGVVLTACYLARSYGIRSAMPMYQARRLCPAAMVVSPNMAKYAAVAREVRRLMRDLTPLVEPVSIDEAFMDLSGTERLHRMIPAQALARFALRVEQRIGVTVSIGLSCNKFLAKVASDLDKPRGFAVLSGNDAAAFLAPRPVSFIFGVGRVATGRLAADGFATIGDLQRASEDGLVRRYGEEGARLFHLARGLDERPVRPERESKSISTETTFERDIADFRTLEITLWRLTEKLSARLKESKLAGSTIKLKLKSDKFQIRTRAQSLPRPTQLASRIFAVGRELLIREIDGTRFRLLGIGVSSLDGVNDDETVDLLDGRLAHAEHAIDRLRKKFGEEAVVKGLALEENTARPGSPNTGRRHSRPPNKSKS